jgi:hypothetical protein
MLVTENTKSKQLNQQMDFSGSSNSTTFRLKSKAV